MHRLLMKLTVRSYFTWMILPKYGYSRPRKILERVCELFPGERRAPPAAEKNPQEPPNCSNRSVAAPSEAAAEMAASEAELGHQGTDNEKEDPSTDRLVERLKPFASCLFGSSLWKRDQEQLIPAGAAGSSSGPNVSRIGKLLQERYAAGSGVSVCPRQNSHAPDVVDCRPARKVGRDGLYVKGAQRQKSVSPSEDAPEVPPRKRKGPVAAAGPAEPHCSEPTDSEADRVGIAGTAEFANGIRNRNRTRNADSKRATDQTESTPIRPVRSTAFLAFSLPSDFRIVNFVNL